MLALRLARGAHAAVLVRRLLVVLASGGTGFLLLSALGYALGHPQAHGTAAVRLAWCLVPVAATIDFAAAVARSDPGTRPLPGVFAAGLGPVRLMAISALTTALACLTGSALALLLFLQLRGDLFAGLPWDGAAGGLLAAGRPLPTAALVLLLALVPVAASVTAALVLRPRSGPGGAPRPADALDDLDQPAPPTRRPAGLSWGIALFAAGLAVETSMSASARHAAGLRLPRGLAGGSLGVLSGWALTAAGLAVAGPALTYACGRLLQTTRPNGLRLLAGRILQQEARRLGRPLGVVCAVASGSYAAVALLAGRQQGAGPMIVIGGLLVGGCTVGTLVMAAFEARRERARTTAALLRLGAPAGALRTAVALRAGMLLVLFAPLTWGVAAIAAVPLG